MNAHLLPNYQQYTISLSLTHIMHRDKQHMIILVPYGLESGIHSKVEFCILVSHAQNVWIRYGIINLTLSDSRGIKAREKTNLL